MKGFFIFQNNDAYLKLFTYYFLTNNALLLVEQCLLAIIFLLTFGSAVNFFCKMQDYIYTLLVVYYPNFFEYPR